MVRPSAEDPWVVKESRTHQGCFYKYNTATQQSEWLPADYAGGGVDVAIQKGRPVTAPDGDTGGMPMLKLKDTMGNRSILTSASSRASHKSWTSDDTTGGSECICTICECGNHACPVHKYKPTKFGGNTRYREDYPAHEIRPTERTKMKRLPQMTPFDPDHFKTQYENDFIGFTPEPPASFRPTVAAIQKCPFTGTTTYRDMLAPKPIEKRAPLKAPLPVKRPLPFDGKTTNSEFLVPHPEVRPRESMAPTAVAIQSAPFEGLSSYKREFHPHDGVEVYKRPVDEFGYDYGPARNLETEHRRAFTPKEGLRCPVLDLFPKQPSAHTGHIHYTKQKRPDYKYFPGRASTMGSPKSTMSP